MRYVSEMIEFRPFSNELEAKINELVENKKKEGYSFISRSFIGKAFALLVFAKAI